jgi:ABC-2 type transport system permease protein
VIALLRSEARRLRSRRLVWILSTLALLGILIGVSIGAAKSHRPTPAQVAEFERANQEELKSCLSGDFISKSDLPPGETMASFCAQVVGTGGTDELQLSALPDILKGTSFLLIVIGLVIGASLVGADWQSGTMATVLTWEPRRVRLLLMRALVVATAVFLMAVLLQAVLSLGIAWAASVRGTTTGAGSRFTHEVVSVIARVGVMTAIGSLIGVAISTVGRSTAASLGVVFVYLALVESLLHGLSPDLAGWLLGVNAAVFVDGKAQDVSDTVVVTVAHATAVVIAYAAILMAVASVSFRGRDVT